MDALVLDQVTNRFGEVPDTITRFGRLKGMAAAAARTKGGDLPGRSGSERSARIQIDELSKGRAQKVQFTATGCGPRTRSASDAAP